MKELLHHSETIDRGKSQPMGWEETFVHHMSDKGLIPKIRKKLLQLSSKTPQIT